MIEPYHLSSNKKSISNKPAISTKDTKSKVIDRSISIIPYFSGILAEIVFFMLCFFLTGSDNSISDIFGAACMLTILRRGYSFYFAGKESAKKKK